MTDKKQDRRRILKGLAVTLPAVWTAPMVKSVVLPAHAQTSQCAAAAGCYNEAGAQPFSFYWPGGVGPHTIVEVQGADCSGSNLGPGILVVASSPQEAASLLSCSPTGPVPTVDPLPEGCNFYVCVSG